MHILFNLRKYTLNVSNQTHITAGDLDVNSVMARLSDLNVNASTYITWESDVFEQLIMHGYDLRKCRNVENEINNIIDMN